MAELKPAMRKEYQDAYRALRFFKGYIPQYISRKVDPHILRCADYSYQAFGYGLRGWRNKRRRRQFWNRCREIAYSRELPF